MDLELVSKSVLRKEEIEGTNQHPVQTRCLESSTSKPIVGTNVEYNIQKFNNNQSKVIVTVHQDQVAEENSDVLPHRENLQGTLQEGSNKSTISSSKFNTDVTKEAQSKVVEKMTAHEEIVKEKSKEPDSKERSKGLHTREGVDDTNQSFAKARSLRKSAARAITTSVDVTIQKSSNNKLEVAVKEIAE